MMMMFPMSRLKLPLRRRRRLSLEFRHEDQSNAGDLETKDDSSGGMSGGKKAGVAIGVISAACIVGLGALVYKKRQQNIRRAQYGYAARREFL
ncbi:UNVERIFIED_CONTAM: hypothetical protein Scaly_0368400 [Sesamum calycinum]|uniref:Uncharacterized protein n=1 Tax=Sesamum calycinum TaxID=2727403 RepID=A0AAW2SCH6_9LAMI